MQPTNIINKSIQKIAQGSYIVLLGTFFNLMMGFIIRVVFVRFTTQEEYGIYSMVIPIIGIFTTLSTLGLGEGSTRYIAYFRGKDEKESVQDTVFSSIVIGLFTSILFMGISFSSSKFIATKIFNSPEISLILTITSITIPFIVITNIGVAIFRGFERAKVSVYVNNILKNIIYLLLLTTVIFLEFSFIEMIYAYVISIIITGIAIMVYLIKKPPLKLKWKEIRINHITKELILNSIPLLAVNILLSMMGWADTLMLGYFKTPEVVGAYNAAYPLASIISIIVSAISFLYVPTVSQLYSKNQITELKIISEISTKWCFMLTLPLFFIIFIFPEYMLNLFFGPRYIGVSMALQILAFKCILDSFFGFNYYMLLSAGKSKLLMSCSLVSACLNIALNLILIPAYGLIGAAVASMLSYALIEVYMTVKLYKFTKYHPFTKSYIKITTISVILIYLFYINRGTFDVSLWTLTIYLVFFLTIYTISLLFSNSLDKNDIEILKEFERKIGGKYLILKRLKISE